MERRILLSFHGEFYRKTMVIKKLGGLLGGLLERKRGIK